MSRALHADGAGAAGRAGDVEVDGAAWLHVYELTAARRRVRGVVGLLDLGGERVEGADRGNASLLPHEGVDVERIERLARRMGRLGIDPAPVLLLCRGREGSARRSRLTELLELATLHEPDHAGRDASGGRHRSWSVQDPDLAAALVACVGSSTLLVADGHHRLAAHLALAERDRADGDGAALALITDDATLAPALEPIHRTSRVLTRAGVVQLLERAGHRVVPDAGTATPVAPPREVAADEVLVLGADGSTRIQVSGDGDTPVVARLHAAIDAVVDEPRWEHHHDASDAERELQSGRGVAVLLPRPTLDQAWSAARRGELLPAKATSFRPKPPLGVLFRTWHDA